MGYSWGWKVVRGEGFKLTVKAWRIACQLWDIKIHWSINFRGIFHYHFLLGCNFRLSVRLFCGSWRSNTYFFGLKIHSVISENIWRLSCDFYKIIKSSTRFKGMRLFYLLVYYILSLLNLLLLELRDIYII